MVSQEISKLLISIIKHLQQKEFWPRFEIPEFLVEKSGDVNHGDYATNIAFKLSPILKKSPMEVAYILVEALEEKSISNFQKVEPAPPGFINFFLSKEFLQSQLSQILKQKEKFGYLNLGHGQKVNLEFISANPTGPLHIGNARGGFCGDVLANVLASAGFKVYREYYINDRGRQIDILQNSLLGQEPAYKNPYIDELKKRNVKDVNKAVEFIVEKIKETTQRMGIKYDKWFYESSLYKKGKIDKIITLLKEKNLIYEEDGALWFKAKQFGDSQDRVLVKSDGEKTYFLSELAYIKDKFERGFDHLVILLGAEHHGYVARLKAGAEALGYDRDRVNPIIYQLVHLIEGGKEVKMSKRTGTYITIDELLNEISLDVARFFFLTRSYGNHFNFDLDLAKQQSEKNPVYYIQYAHARICSILRNNPYKFKIKSQNLRLLTHPSELALIKRLIVLPEIIYSTVKDHQVQRLPQYALDLASTFHQFYRDCQVLSKDKDLIQARLCLIMATKIILTKTLSIMGITAPEKM